MLQPSERIRVLIVDDIADTRENLRKLLSFDPSIEVVGAAGTGEDGVRLARESKPDVILMDINLPGIDGITATEQVVRLVPTAQIIILSVQGETGYMRRAMAAGARDFLIKPPSGDELMSTIRRVYEIGKTQAARIAPPTVAAGSGRQAIKKQGHMVTVFSPKGGVGCTTVAVNLAITLQTRLGAGQRIALLDGNLQFGDLGVMLNLQPTRTIADLAERLEELDGDLLINVMTPHPSGVKVMLAPPHPEAAEPFMTNPTGSTDGGGNSKVRTIVKEMRRQFDLVVADTWNWVDEVTLALLDESVLILLVINPLIPSIKDARNFIDLAHQLGYPTSRVLLVINEADRRTGIRLEQIERALMPAAAHIPYDERAGIIAANRGTPIVSEDLSKPITQAFVQLAATVLSRLQELISVEEQGEDLVSEEDSRRLLGRILM